ncbi:DUF883 family protein [Pluralibacter gergoviae]|uniref:DUF883 family protein n=1 Tax=Pluralibacter gergoviae TaxID=61647 RepID=A0A089PPP6_PLUGE|nr:DUF883 family protein [Pluralibacter gergoviae]AIR00199.1 hypothetical protein LG71_09980 [Pluralibacter gergoviae]AVR05580.1 DUF883 domain-containing protein [Pluralibacter gergoviae]EKT9642281.1 DUF883 family protein [Pluralibacter gergoviae]EKV0916561.1 DUF883 family protein [Pluralibacter gergoviae]EKV0930796.1 DUF883 family protein [Pluralibacter gergoviae]
MFNRFNRRDVEDSAEDIQNEVSQLADSLEAVLKSWGSDAGDEADAAKRKAKALLRETRARLNGRSPTTQAARDAVGCAGTFVRQNPWQTLGAVAALGVFIGALVSLRR